MKLICKIVGNTDTRDDEILIRVTLTTSKIHALDMQEMCCTLSKFGVLPSNDTRFALPVESRR